MSYTIKIFALLFFMINSQQDEVLKAKVIDIIETNQYLVKDESDKKYSVILNDTKPCANVAKSNEALEYVKNKIYGKTVYVIIDKKTGSQIKGSIIYECDELNGNVKNDIPCESANPLDLELIKLGYVTYTGTNKFLKRLSQGVD